MLFGVSGLLLLLFISTGNYKNDYSCQYVFHIIILLTFNFQAPNLHLERLKK